MSALNTSSLWNKSFILCLVNNLFLFIFYFAQTSILPIYILNDLGGSLAQAALPWLCSWHRLSQFALLADSLLKNWEIRKRFLSRKPYFVCFPWLICLLIIYTCCYWFVFYMAFGSASSPQLPYLSTMSLFQKNVKAKAWAILSCPLIWGLYLGHSSVKLWSSLYPIQWSQGF